MKKEVWVHLALHRDEVLQCDSCDTIIINQHVHLCLDSAWDINEVLCAKCWEEKNEL